MGGFAFGVLLCQRLVLCEGIPPPPFEDKPTYQMRTGQTFICRFGVATFQTRKSGLVFTVTCPGREPAHWDPAKERKGAQSMRQRSAKHERKAVKEGMSPSHPLWLPFR